MDEELSSMFMGGSSDEVLFWVDWFTKAVGRFPSPVELQVITGAADRLLVEPDPPLTCGNMVMSTLELMEDWESYGPDGREVILMVMGCWAWVSEASSADLWANPESPRGNNIAE